MFKYTTLFSFALLCGIPLVLAQSKTTLLFPGGDSEISISADFLSTDSQGRTAWAIQIDDFPATATLIEGPGFISLGFQDAEISNTLNQACGITSDVAVCTATVNGEVMTSSLNVATLTVDVGKAPPTGTSIALTTITGSPSRTDSSPTDTSSTFVSTPISGTSTVAAPASSSSNAAIGCTPSSFMIFISALLFAL
ncbi:hypothetical protein AMATHDRAFT_64087 [Amanita thiersii Skay4041]|uniref:Uncharacterized protein n=1 Tax=Amanita thiersii Skay4041 TaxID=703135 RepID=A0A2A9NMN4_9AGAR|nr:hypothetical protein AMATHDRAFT_64087 [Amanita thiersii Skay4041]